MASAASQIPPPTVDLDALRKALADLPGIVEVRAVRGTVWVVRDDVDVECDERIIGALLDVLDPAVEFHFVPVKSLGMVPDGDRVL